MISHNSSNTVVLSREEATPRGTLEQYIALERTFRPPGLIYFSTSFSVQIDF